MSHVSVRAGKSRSRNLWLYFMFTLLVVLVACLLYLGPGNGTWIQWLIAGTTFIVCITIIELSLENMFNSALPQ